MMSIQV